MGEKSEWRNLVISDKNWLLFSLYVSYQILIDIERENDKEKNDPILKIVYYTKQKYACSTDNIWNLKHHANGNF